MRIALVCTDSNVVYVDPRRCPTRLRGMAESFARVGHEVHLLLAGTQMAVEGIAVREMRVPVTAREIDWHFSQIQPDLVIERLVPGNLECARAAGESGVSLLYDIESEAIASAPDEVAAVIAAAVALVPSVGAVVSRDEDVQGLGAIAGTTLRVDVIEDAVAPELLRLPGAPVMAQVSRRLRLVSGENRVGFLGPLTPNSGVLDLIRAAAEMRERGVPRLVLMGDGPARNEALRLAVDLDVRVVLCGWVSDDELSAHLSACDSVVTSAGSGVLPMLQAMAAWRAVIAPDSAAARRIARDGVEARIVPPGNVLALAAALREMSDDAKLRARYGESASTRVSRSFTWEAQGARVLEFAGTLGEKSRAM